MMRTSFLILLGLAAIVSSSSAAQESVPDRIEMGVGSGRIFRTESAVSNVVVGNPRVADVLVIGDRTITVSAKEAGFTSIIALDEGNQVISSTEINVVPAERAGREVVTVHMHSADNDQKLEYLCDVTGRCVSAITEAQQPPPVTINMIAPTQSEEQQTGR